MAGDGAAPVSRPRVTVLGAEEWLVFEAAIPLQKKVSITFTAVGWPEPAAFGPVEWQCDGEAEPVPVDGGTSEDGESEATSGRRMRVPWVVGIDGHALPPTKRFQLVYVIRGRTLTGEEVFGAELDPLVVDHIDVTDDPKLTRIMRHEFNTLGIPRNRDGTPTDEDYVFDPGPAHAYVDSLTSRQKLWLLNYDVSAHDGNRLVSFITLMPDQGVEMYADHCRSGPTRVVANASLATFHCYDRGPNGRGVQLVCYTRCFVVNLYNGHTKKLLHSPQPGKGGKPAREWLSRDNPQPVMFKIGCCMPSSQTHMTLYNRILYPDGNDGMPSNTMHGMINTKGCWMLFRNYNWPLTVRSQARDLYLTRYRSENRAIYRRIHPSTPTRWPETAKRVRRLLGYDDDSLLKKFREADRNLAFKWFFHDVVGVAYHAPDPYEHDVNVHGRMDLRKLPEQMGAPRYPNPTQDGYAGYDVELRRKADHAAGSPHFKADHDLLIDNALGFRTASRFLPWTLKKPVGGELAQSGTWCDLYLYAGEDVDIDKLTTNYSAHYEPSTQPSTSGDEEQA